MATYRIESVDGRIIDTVDGQLGLHIPVGPPYGRCHPVVSLVSGGRLVLPSGCVVKILDTDRWIEVYPGDPHV